MQIPAMESRSPRFYHLFLQSDLLGGWSLVKEWGLQGSGGRVKREYYEDYATAEMALMAGRDAQIKRGYRVVFAEGQRQAGV